MLQKELQAKEELSALKAESEVAISERCLFFLGLVWFGSWSNKRYLGDNFRKRVANVRVDMYI